MPEGDTIYRSATRLAQALEGHEVDVVDLPRWAGRTPDAGELVASVDAIGKHLLVSFSGGLVLASHMKMTGSWHLYRRGERWQRARSRMRAVVSTCDWEAVCFDAPVVRLCTPGSLRRELAHLGPDLTTGATPAVVEQCLVRVERICDAGTIVSDVLRDQRVCCGVGNVYASEVCWFEQVHPATPVGALPVPIRRLLVERASGLLAANLGPGRRATLGRSLAAYGRRGQPCPRCGTPIRADRVGRHARITYWCPTCQPLEVLD